MAASTHRQMLSKRCEFLLNFPVSGSRSFKLKSNNDVYNEKNNPQGIINLSNAESYISAKFIDEWMKTNSHFEWTPEDQLYYSFHGAADHRKKLAEFINHRFNPSEEVNADNLVLGHGAEGVMECLAFALADCDDYFLIITPYYYNIDQDFMMRAGVKLWAIKTSGRNQDKPFQVTEETLDEEYDIAAKSGCHIRGLILINPKNPLGTMYSSEELLSFVNFCSKHDLHLVVDEVYSQTVFHGHEKFISVLSLSLPKPDNVHMVYSLSKDFALSGLRVGLLVTRNQQLLQTFKHGRQSLFSSVPTFISRTAVNLVTDNDWLDNIYYPNIHMLMRENYGQITTCLDRLRVPYLEAHAGFFIWADFSRYIRPCTFRNEEIFTENLVDKGRVCLMPGQLFHCAEPGWFRIVITHEVETTKLAMARLEKYLKDGSYLNLYVTDDHESTFVSELTMVTSTEGGEVENLLRTLTQQIRSSDWLSENTAEKWQVENPQLATEFSKLRSIDHND